MRGRILDAAIRVLRDEGALGFTTTRVANDAGISVGSLYQYFPNKHSLVVAVHRQAVEVGWQHVQVILDHPRWPPRRKVTEIARWFFATEASEAAELGAVFENLDVFLGEDVGADFDAVVHQRLTRFLGEATDRTIRAERLAFEVDLLLTTLESVGKALASRPLTPRQRDRWATSTAAMLCDHLHIAGPR
jgi:AcrR family transcriptional regulator